MVPWRLAHGERLYRDVQFQHGPLGPYLAASVDGIAGRSLPARTALHALVALLHVAALSRLARRMLSPWRAALTTSTAIATAVFLWPGGWMFPFSFDAALAVAALTWALVLGTHPQPNRGDIWAGACLLAALLSRPELGLAGICILGASACRSPRRLVPLGVAPLAAAAAGYALLSAGIPRHRLVADGWLVLVEPPEAFQNVYRAYAGLDRPGLRTTELLLAAVVLALVATLLAAASWIASRLTASGRPLAGGAVATLAVGTLALAALIRLRPPASLAEQLALIPPLVRVIPACLAIAAVLRLIAVLRGRAVQGPFSGVPDAVLWMSAVFGARLFLAAGYVGPYGAFFLPLPLVVAAAGFFGLADRAAPALGSALPRLAAAALTVFLAFRLAAAADFYRRLPWSPVATPIGTLRLPAPVADATAEALAGLSRLPAGASLAGFPEAGFLNYALGLRNPFWLEQFFPGRLDGEGEARAIAVLAHDPPDALVRVNVLAVGEGARAFGQDYLVDLDAAVRARYTTSAIFGPEARPGARIGDPQFFVEIAAPVSPRAKTGP